MNQHSILRGRALLLCAALIAMAGCSTQVKVSNLTREQQTPGARVDGIPFRVAERFELLLYEKVDGKYVQREVTQTLDTFADPDRLYLLSLQGMPLSQGTVTLKINPDGTLARLKVASTSKGQDALTEVGAGLKKIAEADAAREKADATHVTAAETAVSSEEDRRVAALQAQHEAELAALELDALPPTATAVVRRAAEQKVAKLRVVANQRARRAALPLPFPDAGI